jgi:predicted phage gp36 major capsid-like protein
MNAKELADELEKDIHWIQDELARKWVVDMLRQQQAELDRAVELYTDKAIENEALKMGFAGNGTSDSELAEVRAQANRWFLKIKEQQAEIEALKAHLNACQVAYNPKKHGAEE